MTYTAQESAQHAERQIDPDIFIASRQESPSDPSCASTKLEQMRPRHAPNRKNDGEANRLSGSIRQRPETIEAVCGRITSGGWHIR